MYEPFCRFQMYAVRNSTTIPPLKSSKTLSCKSSQRTPDGSTRLIILNPPLARWENPISTGAPPPLFRATQVAPRPRQIKRGRSTGQERPPNIYLQRNKNRAPKYRHPVNSPAHQKYPPALPRGGICNLLVGHSRPTTPSPPAPRLGADVAPAARKKNIGDIFPTAPSLP